LPEVIEDGKTGVLLPLEDTEAWAQKTLSLLNDQKLRECLAVGAEAASKHYTMAVVGPAFEVMLQTALTASHQPVGAHL
jgi:glycosyltransferase involved in cell wall biosynthesis